MRPWLGLVGLLGCSAPAPAPSLPPGPEGIAAWRQARGQVEAIRERHAPGVPYRMNVSLELTQVQLGQRMRARGAVAVRPPDSLRMILLGPGGTTALDLWICRDAFRFAVPAIDLERRGDAHTPPEQLRGLPVSFLRWWFLRPLDGRLLSFVDGDVGRRFVMRDGTDVVHLFAPSGGPLRAERRSLLDAEEVVVDGDGTCGEVRYLQGSTGLDITVRCEELTTGSPPAAAFADPDDPEQSCGSPSEEPS